MHDVSMAQAVTAQIIKKVHGERVKEIEIDLAMGSLRFHNTEQVEFWIKEILKKELGNGNDLNVKTNITVVKPEIKCGCGYTGKVNNVETTEELAHHGVFEMKCPECGSDEYEIVKGNDCIIKSVKITD